MNPLKWTNDLKGVVTGALILIVEGLEVFGLYDFTPEQKSWTQSAIGLVAIVFIWTTRRLSPKRIPD